MVKRKRLKSERRILLGATAEAGTLMLLVGALALAIHKGLAGVGTIRIGLVLACLTAGGAGMIWGPKGEGSVKQRQVSCGIPALTVMLLSLVLSGEETEIMHGALHALCLFLPCLISLAVGGKHQKRSAPARKMRRMGVVHR